MIHSAGWVVSIGLLGLTGVIEHRPAKNMRPCQWKRNSQVTSTHQAALDASPLVGGAETRAGVIADYALAFGFAGAFSTGAALRPRPIDFANAERAAA